MKINIIPFRKEYTHLLYNVIKKTIREIYSSLYPIEIINYFLSYNAPENILIDSIEGYTALFFKDNQLIGSGSLVETNIRRLFVLPEYQLKGIGTAILKHIEQKALEKNCKYLELYAMMLSVNFYRKMGYSELGICNYIVDNSNSVDYMKMEKKLK
jgi:GNAT superfamily N-acetyltransferase